MKKATILIVEDDAKFMKSLLALVESKGFSALGVESASEALAFMDGERERVVLVTDINLEGDSGLDLLAKTGMNYPHIPVIVITGYASLNSAIRALKLGAYDYITKPFEPEFFFHSLRRAYEKLMAHNEKVKTERKMKKFVRELEAKNEEIEKLSNFKSFMMSMTSHDLKTILTVLNGYHKMIRDKCAPNLTDQDNKVFDEGDKSLKRALLMIESLLDYHAIEMGTINLQLTEFFIEEVIDECVDFLRPYAEMKNVEVSKKIGKDDGLTVCGDRLKVIQILDNLITNSIKFASSGGYIHVLAKKTGDGKIKVSVRDTGSGIPRDKLNNILSSNPEIFKREGTGIIGLGLSICKKLVEVQKGVLEIESFPGKGTEVSFTLPSRNK
jgi:signal transduction histidine kinase